MCYLERRVDPADQRVQDVNVVMTMQQDEGQEVLQEGGLRDGAQEQIQVRSGGHHFLHGQLNAQQTGERRRTNISIMKLTTGTNSCV